MKWRVLLFAVFVVATAVAAERWWSPDKFYSIVPPADWKHSESKTAAGFGYAFTRPTDSQKFASRPPIILTCPVVCQKTRLAEIPVCD